MGNRLGVLTNADHVELETSLQELALDLGGDAVETDMAVGENSRGGHFVCILVEWMRLY